MEDDADIILRDVFGGSSDGEEPQEYELDCPSRRESSELDCERTHSWEQISKIDGLWLSRNFLSSDQQASLHSAINREGWFDEASGNQAMRFGELPGWAIELSNSIREVVFHSDNDHLFELVDRFQDICHFPSDLLWREPLFDQLIVNIYQPGNMCTC